MIFDVVFKAAAEALNDKSGRKRKFVFTGEQMVELTREITNTQDDLDRFEELCDEQSNDLLNFQNAYIKEQEACKQWREKAYANQQEVISLQAVVDNLTRQLESIKKVIK